MTSKSQKKAQKNKDGQEDSGSPQVTLDEALSLAQGHHQAGNLLLAERTYRDILRSVPEHFPTTHMLGILLFQTRQYDESKKYMEKAVEGAPDNPNCYNNYGGALIQTHELEDALKAFEKALELKPDYTDALTNKGHTLARLGRLDEAEKTLRQALDLAPDNLTVLNHLGVTLARRIKYEEALDIWEKVTSLNPEDASGWINWGNTLREMGKLKESREKCQKAVDLAPKNPEALNNLGNALRDLGRADEAVECYRSATNEKPDYYEAHNNMAIAHADNIRFEDAAIAARYAVAFKDDFADGHISLAKALAEQGDYVPALMAAQKAVRLKPEDPLGYLELADVLIRADRLLDGEAAMQEAIKREPDSPRSYLKLAELRERMNSFSEAHEAIDKAIDMSPSMPALWIRKGLIYYTASEVEKGLQAIDEALKLAPDVPSAIQSKAEMLITLGRNDEAEKLVRRVLAKTTKLPGPYWILTSIKKFESEDDEDYRNMKALEKTIHTFGTGVAANYYFALSDVYEDMKKYDLSFEYLQKANDMKFKSLPVSAEGKRSRETHGAVKEKYTKALIEHFADKNHDSSLPVFIVGMPRSGTTLTEQIISSHPDVFGAGELPFIGDVLRLSQTGEIADPKALAEEYLRLAGQRMPSGDYLRITDKMPANYANMGFIACIFKNAKIIHCRRNPIDTCLSCYKQNFARGQYWSYNLERMAEEYKVYLDMMEHWRSIMPDRFIEIDYEETVNNTEAQARRLIEYVGLEWNDACLEPHKQKRAILTASKAQVTQPVYTTSVEKWRRYEKHLQPLVRPLMPGEALAD